MNLQAAIWRFWWAVGRVGTIERLRELFAGMTHEELVAWVSCPSDIG